jgi:hypothetical protein
MGDADECSGNREFAERRYQSSCGKPTLLSVEAIKQRLITFFHRSMSQ